MVGKFIIQPCQAVTRHTSPSLRPFMMESSSVFILRVDPGAKHSMVLFASYLTCHELVKVPELYVPSL